MTVLARHENASLCLPLRVPGQPPASSDPEPEAGLSASRHHTDLLVLQSELGPWTHRQPRGAGPVSERGVKSGSRSCVVFIYAIGFLFLNTKARCLLNSVPPAARCGDIFLNDNTEGANLGHRRVDPARPLHPAPSPYSGERGPAFQPGFRLHVYMADKIFHFTPLPVGPAVLREKGLYDSSRDSLRVA